MKLNAQTPKQSLNKAFLKQPVNRDDINSFKANLQTLLGKINDKESEEHHKNFIRDFLKDTFYKSDYEINTKGKQDLVIHVGKNASDKVGVILEAKKPTAKAEMISAENPNKKALHELILYYLNERNEADNFELKNLVITDIYQWFIFDANLFDKQIYRNTQIKRLYQTYKADKKDNPFFYGELQKIIANFDETIDCAVFDIRDYETALKNDDDKDDESLIELFKILSPHHLLKVPFADDSNKLDKNFYTELLHIIGLEEIKDKGKLKIDRKAEERRDAGSLIENVITIIKTEDLLPNVTNIENYGETKETRLFNIALDLCLTWTNRILFLKLLEAQLIDYHNGNREYRFLDTDTIKDFDGLYRLFHQVLAINFDERIAQVREKFRRVPYLNSSLFEFTDLEKQTLKINGLSNDETLNFINSTVLKEIRNQGGELPTLEYLFKFLDAYDFASEGVSGITENNRSLINASVLGKVFEKINGYKDGSIYTPGFITMYMCRQAIRLAVVQKFKDAYGWNVSEFADIKNYLADRRSKADVLEFNRLINSLHLCDPAVGSGHFLVSSLNEIIAVKCELGILADANGERFRDVEITIENDELTVFDTERNEFFKYRITDGKPNSKEAQRLQKTLFHEKQTLIENCLFGVDINPNSVKICRLRLWIELLKNAYYKESGNYAELETLPNIDINIKEGNSLLSRFALDADLTQILKQIKYNIEDYRNFVLGYKETRDREKKREFEAKIKQIKDDFKTQLFFFSPERRKLADFENQLKASESKQFLFGETDEEKAKRFKDEETFKSKIAKAKETVKQIEENAIYRNAFEWRFEFPEVLDDKGNFTGFDIVIGNPPYGVRADGQLKEHLKKTYSANEDIYTVFIEVGSNLISLAGSIFYIIPVTWHTGDNYLNTRRFIKDNLKFRLGITLPYNVFENVYIDTGLYFFTNDKTYNTTSKVYEYEAKDKIDFESIQAIQFIELSDNEWQKEENLKIFFNKTIRNFQRKLSKIKYSINDISKSARGILANETDYSSTRINESFEPVFDGKLDRYFIEDKFQYVKYGDNLKEKPTSNDYFSNERILIRRIVSRQFRVMCSLAFDDFVNKKDIYTLKICNPDFNSKYVLSILNSRLISFLKTRSSNSAKKDDFTQLTLNEIREIKIPEISEKDQQPFIALVDQILELKKEGKDTQALENEIDTLVYRLYDLTDEEIAIVEGK